VAFGDQLVAMFQLPPAVLVQTKVAARLGRQAVTRARMNNAAVRKDFMIVNNPI
jgi:hypothetical protein